MRLITKTVLIISATVITTGAFAQQTPSLEKMWRLMQQQQNEIKKLKHENKQLKKRLNHVSSASDKPAGKRKTRKASNKSNNSAPDFAYTSVVNDKPPIVHKHNADNNSGKHGRVVIHGYGEMHYNNLDSGKEIDFHRFVLMFGYNFTNRLRFVSEVELEHSISGDGKVGEVELEQAYIEYDFNNKHRFKAGLFLLPVGILNETHEPTTFYGVERNPVESNIIPSTWWEGGVMFSGQLGNKGLSYDFGLHSGLKVTAANSYKVRNGRQKVGEADANDLAYTARLRWTGFRGLAIGATVQHQENIGQSADPTVGSANYFDINLVWNRGPLSVRGLYAMWDLDGSGPASIGADKQEGWYVETSYKFRPKLGAFIRYSEWDNTAGDSVDSKKEQWNVGFNYWLQEKVVLKFDYQDQKGTVNDDGFNLGVGFHF